MEEQVDKLRLLLKRNILRNDTFYGYEKEYNQVLDLLKKTVEISESNSALLIGPRGSGKTTVSSQHNKNRLRTYFLFIVS